MTQAWQGPAATHSPSFLQNLFDSSFNTRYRSLKGLILSTLLTENILYGSMLQAATQCGGSHGVFGESAERGVWSDGVDCKTLIFGGWKIAKSPIKRYNWHEFYWHQWSEFQTELKSAAQTQRCSDLNIKIYQKDRLQRIPLEFVILIWPTRTIGSNTTQSTEVTLLSELGKTGKRFFWNLHDMSQKLQRKFIPPSVSSLLDNSCSPQELLIKQYRNQTQCQP